MCASHEQPDTLLERELEEMIRGAVRSPAHALDVALAAAAECPTPEDVARLDDGRLADPTRRRALARHLVACPRCAESHLAALLAADVAPAVAATPVLALRRGVGVAAWAAAAALLLVTFVGLEPAGRAPSALGGAWLVDPFGLELRSAPEPPIARRVSVRVEADGWLALVRRDAESVLVEAVDGAARTTVVRAGEEVVLPLGRALPVPATEDWLVLHMTTQVEGDALEALARRVVKGARPDGVDVRRFPVLPTRTRSAPSD